MAMLFALVTLLPACRDDEPTYDGGSYDKFEELAERAKKSLPTAYECDIAYKAGVATLYGRYVMTFATVRGEKCARLEYEYEKLSAVGESDDFISTLSGVHYAKNEQEIDEMLSSVGSKSGDPTTLLKLEKSLFKTYEISDKNGLIILSGELCDGALGENTSAATLTLESPKEAGTVSRIKIEYIDAYGAGVRAQYSFSYEEQNIELPK